MRSACISTRSPSRSSSGAETSGEAVLFLTAGGNQVDAGKASALAGEPLGKADADLVRGQTGFVIGGVAPVGHLNPIRAWFDPRILDFDVVWAAAGTPRHVFPIAPGDLLRISGARAGRFHGLIQRDVKKIYLRSCEGPGALTYRVM